MRPARIRSPASTLDVLAAAVRRAVQRAGRRRADARRCGRGARARGASGDVVITLGAGSIGSVPDAADRSPALEGARRRMSAGRRAGRSAISPRARQAVAQAMALARDARQPLAGYAALALVLASASTAATRVAAAAHVLEVDRIVVRGNARLSKGEVLAVLNGLRGENIAVDRSRRVAPPAAGVALGAGRRAAAVAALDRGSDGVGADADRHRPHQRRRCTSSTTRRGHRSSTARSTPTSICRSSTGSARRRRTARSRTKTRAELAARVIAGAQSEAAARAAGCRRWT